MSSIANIEDQRAFSKELFVLIAGGLGAGAVASGLQLIAGQSQPELMVLSFGAIVGLLANFRDSRSETPTFRLMLGVMAGVTMALLGPVSWIGAGAAGGFLIGAAVSYDKSSASGVLQTGMGERALTWCFYALALAAGIFTTQTLFTAGFLQTMDVPLLGKAIEGGIWGLFLSLAAGVKHLRWERDVVNNEFAEALADVGAEERKVLTSGSTVYRQIVRELERTEQGGVSERARGIATEMAQSLIAVARRTDELRRAMERSRCNELNERIEELDKRIAASTDPAVRSELQAARNELAEQVQARQRIEVACARLEARQQRCMTGLERLNVALIHNSSMTSNSVSLEDSLDNLQRFTEEVQWKNLCVDELCSDDTAATSLDVDAEEEHHLGASDGDAEAPDADGADLEEPAGEAESEPEPTKEENEHNVEPAEEVAVGGKN